ncbi:hypothetical protein J1605_002114 [Eschrichtius robustus]|uniref:Uncharacterized protein n=1 Tax=Eschrichtius robustus TaxID=9764 RepID=A0AB34HUK8_ESCRO|nr:hypothetical protein J1605_002114 [Eschrichtius robustus]
MSQAPVFTCTVPTVNSLVQEVRQQHFWILGNPAKKKSVISYKSKNRNADATAWYRECDVQPAEGALLGFTSLRAVSRSYMELQTDWGSQTLRTVPPQQHPSLESMQL